MQKHGVRIIVGNFYENKAGVIFCEAFKQNMYGAKYAWIITGKKRQITTLNLHVYIVFLLLNYFRLGWLAYLFCRYICIYQLRNCIIVYYPHKTVD